VEIGFVSLVHLDVVGLDGERSTIWLVEPKIATGF